MRIVFHGQNAAVFSTGFADLLDDDAEVLLLPDRLESQADREAFATADVIIGIRFDASMPRPDNAKLFHVPGAGYDAVDLDALPPAAMVCNCFGHEHAIAEYVLTTLLMRHIPVVDADRRLRKGDWEYSATTPGPVHSELAGSTIGILGFGHIGKEVALRAKAFGMSVVVANRSAVRSDLVDRAYGLADLDAFWGSADSLVITLPLVPETKGIVGVDAFSRMRSHAVLVNVARGPVVDEAALYEALRDNRIGGAVIDTWYCYPMPGQAHCMPANLPFHELGNVTMTPHMSGWTNGTLRRRQQTMAANIRARALNGICENVIRMPV